MLVSFFGAGKYGFIHLTIEQQSIFLSHRFLISCETMRHKCLAAMNVLSFSWLVYALGSRSKLGWMMLLFAELCNTYYNIMFGILTLELDLRSPKLAKGPRTSR